MEITPTNAAAPAAKTQAGAAAKEAGTSAAPTSDFDTFLKLLTAQLQNQDPLKPMESTEFVAQLASFSAVEQQVRTNEHLEGIFGALGGGSPAGLAAWIGKEVRAPIKGAFAGVPIEIATTPKPDANRATLVVTNDFGKVVAERAIDPKASVVSWDGKDALGNGLPHGSYAFKIDSYRDDKPLGSTPGELFAKVEEVRIEDGAAVLLLEGGAKVAASEVSALR